MPMMAKVGTPTALGDEDGVRRVVGEQNRARAGRQRKKQKRTTTEKDNKKKPGQIPHTTRKKGEVV